MVDFKGKYCPRCNAVFIFRARECNNCGVPLEEITDY